jgi:hypothetical protein
MLLNQLVKFFSTQLINANDAKKVFFSTNFRFASLAPLFANSALLETLATPALTAIIGTHSNNAKYVSITLRTRNVSLAKTTGKIALNAMKATILL